MPIYEYNGQQYDIDTTDKDAAKSKILEYVQEQVVSNERQKLAIENAQSYAQPVTTTDSQGEPYTTNTSGLLDAAAIGLMRGLGRGTLWDKDTPEMAVQSKAMDEYGPFAYQLGKATPAMVGAAVAPVTIPAQAAVGGLSAYAVGDNPVKGAVAGAIIPGMSALATRMTQVPSLLSGVKTTQAYKAGVENNQAYKELMRGNTTIDEAVAQGLSQDVAENAVKSGKIFPDTEHIAKNTLANIGLSLSPTATVAQAIGASPRVGAELSYMSGRIAGMSAMADRMIKFGATTKYTPGKKYSGFVEGTGESPSEVLTRITPTIKKQVTRAKKLAVIGQQTPQE